MFRPNCSPEVQHIRTERRKQRSSLAFTRKMRREERALAHHWRLRQNLLGQAVTELNFQSPETVSSWYRRWSNEFDARELAPAFWHWRSRYASLASLDWLRDAGEPLCGVIHEISFIVRETPESVRQAERWQGPEQADTPEPRMKWRYSCAGNCRTGPARVHRSWFPLSWRQGVIAPV